MCRWLAYSGPPIFLDSVVLRPENSLIDQSRRALESARWRKHVAPAVLRPVPNYLDPIRSTWKRSAGRF